jgi:hypothetical protein
MQNSRDAESSFEKLNERRLLFWCLFTVDQDASLLLGTPPNFHLHDCDVQYPEITTYDFKRRIDTALVTSKIYSALYSPGAYRTTTQQMETCIEELYEELDRLRSMISHVSAEDIGPMGRSWQFLMLEQIHTIHHAKLMTMRKSTKPELYEQRLTEARQCIRTLGKLHGARPSVGGFMVLRR